jgi:prepilin-type processing-associated H-X9-DG protein
MHNYHDTNDCFPVAGLPCTQSSGAISTVIGTFSGQTRLLAYTEQKAAYDAVNFSLCVNPPTGGDTYGTQANATISTLRLNVFLCPSCPPPAWNVTYVTLTNFVAPGLNYFESCGSSLAWQANMTLGPPNGPFQYGGSPLGVRDITDGTSNTIAFGEWKIGDGNNKLYTYPTDFVAAPFIPPLATNTPYMSMPFGATPFLQWLPQCAAANQAATNAGNQWSYVGMGWAFEYFALNIGNVLQPPNTQYPNCTSNTVVGGLPFPAMIGLRSYHPGGANVLMCDGSVRFLKDSTNVNTIWALGSRDQGEVVSADSY